MDSLPNSLADLAERVKEASEACLAAQRTSIETAIKAGKLLCQAKDDCGHGLWTPFLARAGLHERTARNYMTLSRSGLKPETVSDLGGIKAALSFLADWRLPAFDEALFIHNRLSSDTGSAAFVWEDDMHRGYYHVGTLVGLDRKTGDFPGTCFATKRPMKPSALIYGLSLPDTFDLPISQWALSIVRREMAWQCLAPFITDNTFNQPWSGALSA